MCQKASKNADWNSNNILNCVDCVSRKTFFDQLIFVTSIEKVEPLSSDLNWHIHVETNCQHMEKRSPCYKITRAICECCELTKTVQAKVLSEL